MSSQTWPLLYCVKTSPCVDVNCHATGRAHFSVQLYEGILMTFAYRAAIKTITWARTIVRVHDIFQGKSGR